MTGTRVTVDDDDPLEQLKKLKAQQAQADPLAALKATKGARPAGHDYHAEYASGALEKRMQGANARDMANAAENTEVVGPGAAFGHALGATMANAGEGIPGFEAAQAGIRSLASRLPNVSMQGGVPLVTPGPGAQSYRDALSDLRHETDQIPGALKAGERIVGAMPLTKFLPASPLAGGAILGGTDMALSADPGQSVGRRALKTVAGAAGGALVGKAGETLVTAGRTLFSKTAAANVIERLAKRAASAQQLYSAALREGKGKLGTVAIKRFLNEPDIAEIVSELQASRPLQGTPAEAPEMLDAVYKTLSDRAAQLRKGLDALHPNRPNIGRHRLADTKAAQEKLLQAMEAPGEMTITETAPAITTAQSPAPSIRDAIGNFWDRIGIAHARKEGTTAQQMARTALERHGAENVVSPPLSGAPPGPREITRTVEIPPVMPSYRTAVEDFAEHSKGIEGVKKGYDAVRTATSKTLPRSANLTRTTPESLEEWARAMDDATKSAAGEGAMGAVKSSWGNGPIRGVKATMKAPSVMRATGDPTQALIDYLIASGMIAGNAAR